MGDPSSLSREARSRAIAERWKGQPPLPERLEERWREIVARLREAGARLVYLFRSAARSDEAAGIPPGDLGLAV